MRQWLLLFLCFTTLCVGAQVQRGDLLLPLNSAVDLDALPTNKAAFIGLLDDAPAVAISPRLSYAVADGLLLGGELTLVAEEGDFIGIFQPSLRYYFVNQPRFMAFGRAATQLVFGEGLRNTGNINLGAGVSLPLSWGILLSPLLSYNIDEGRNSFSISAGIDILMGGRFRDGDAPQKTFARGDIMLGLNRHVTSFTERSVSSGMSVNGHYFLGGRFALGASLNYDVLSLEFNDETFKSNRYGFGLSARYLINTGKRWLFFAEGGAGIAIFRQSGLTNFGEFRESEFLASANAGVQYWLRDNVALELGPRLDIFLEENDTQFTLPIGVRFTL